MIKQITVTFDFNSETEEVSNIKVADKSEKKKTTTKKVKDIVVESSNPTIILESNKLVFSQAIVSEMKLEPDDRIVIKWDKVGNTMIPIIGKDIAFDEEGSGNKVTKSNTVTYKGKSNTALANYGSEFTISKYRDDVWKLVPVGTEITENTSLEQVIEMAQNVEPELIIDTDDTTEIDEFQFKF